MAAHSGTFLVKEHGTLRALVRKNKDSCLGSLGPHDDIITGPPSAVKHAEIGSVRAL